jgi:hypothetical protein
VKGRVLRCFIKKKRILITYGQARLKLVIDHRHRKKKQVGSARVVPGQPPLVHVRLDQVHKLLRG